MQPDDSLLLLSESKLKRLLDESAERVARRVLRDVVDIGAAGRPGKGWITNAEAMEYLGLARPTLARYRAEGKIPFSKVGSSVYYRLSDVEAMLEANLRTQ